ncbi:hypothetical protein FS842_001714 [Serendipita sp. 407]|nr:hypothetical protein FS842_001714 [Serendipita sp. 407]
MASANEKMGRHLDDDFMDHDDSKMTVKEYLSTRISTLKPPMKRPPNPIKVLGSLSKMNWLMFLLAFLGWTWDAFDFFTVSLTGTLVLVIHSLCFPNRLSFV